MKTKNLMTAFALSAIFAACTQDAELNETLAKNDFSNIPMVEAEFTADFGVESRMATKFGFEVGDKVGLAWLGFGDVMLTDNLNNKGGVAYQNHPLFCTDAAKKGFKTETMLYAGEYFAYLPYTQGNMTIENIPFSIAEQPLTTNANDLAKQAIYLSTENVTLQTPDADGKVTEGNQKAGMGNNVKLGLELLNNPATIKFSFKNIDALTGLKVTGVEVALMDNSLSTSSIMPVKFNYNGFTSSTCDFTEENSNALFFSWNNAYTAGNVTLKGELAVTNDALTTYALLLPARQASANPYFVITLTTNYGTVVAENVEVDNTKIFNSFGQAATIEAEVDGKNIKNTAATVKTQAELNEVLTKLAASAQEDAVTITLNPETAANPKAAFTLTDFTLPEGLKAKVNLIAGGKTNGTIEFAGTTIINKPIIVHSASVVTGNMTVNYIKNETTLNHVGLTVSHDATLTNNGIISGNIKTVAADEEEELGFGKFIVNYKDAKLINGSKIENLGEAQWIAGEKPEVVAETNDVYAIATNLAGIETANAKSIRTVRLIDGAIVENLGESITYVEINSIECYGEVAFNLTATPRNAATTLSFPYANITVKEGANVEVASNKNTNNLVLYTTVTVEKNANLDIQNVASTFTINNAGSVKLFNAAGIVKGTQAEGSTWESILQN